MVFFVAVFILVIYGADQMIYVGSVLALNSYTQFFSKLELSKLSLTQAFPESPFPFTVKYYYQDTSN